MREFDGAVTPRICGDRPHGSLIFQWFPGDALAATPDSGLLAGFPSGGDPWTNSDSVHFSFFEMWYDASVDVESVGGKGGIKKAMLKL